MPADSDSPVAELSALSAKVDDIVVALLGGSCLFLLRPRAQGEYKFLGPVVGFGDGFLPVWSRSSLEPFVLV